MSKSKKTAKTRRVRQLMEYINATPALLSLLYDMDFMPEQLEPVSRNWFRMLMLAEAWKENMSNARHDTGREKGVPLPCPKCHSSDVQPCIGGYFYCAKCGLEGTHCRYLKTALRAWNAMVRRHNTTVHLGAAKETDR